MANTTPLEYITLQEAKNYLEVDFPDYDKDIESAIIAAVDWVERYTCYRLYKRDEIMVSSGCQMEIYDYPINSITVENDNGDDVAYKTTNRSLKVLLTTGEGATVTLNVGYDLRDDVPSVLRIACFKLITYIYENRDAYQMGLPTDIQGLINQFRRAII